MREKIYWREASSGAGREGRRDFIHNGQWACSSPSRSLPPPEYLQHSEAIAWLGWISSLPSGQGKGREIQGCWIKLPGHLCFINTAVLFLTGRFAGLLLKGTSTKGDVSIPNRWKGGITDSFSLAWVMDVAAKKQMNTSSYCWSPVTTWMISYSGEVRMGIVL